MNYNDDDDDFMYDMLLYEEYRQSEEKAKTNNETKTNYTNTSTDYSSDIDIFKSPGLFWDIFLFLLTGGTWIFWIIIRTIHNAKK